MSKARMSLINKLLYS